MDSIDIQIAQLLDQVEQEYNVSIILAVESGSRAWGFPSRDSDYDIRFIYQHEKDWYSSVFPRRDVIENMFVGELDAGGWDLRKALQLMYRGNAPLWEWLGSPIVYRKDDAKLDVLLKLASQSVNPKALYYHYRSLAKKKIMSKDEFLHKPKSFLYGLRALLCAKWVIDRTTPPPVEFAQLVHSYLDNSLKVALKNLMAEKLVLGEGDRMSIGQELADYAVDEFNGLDGECLQNTSTLDTKVYEEAFRQLLE